MIEMLLVGGPSDGVRIRVNRLLDMIEVMDPVRPASPGGFLEAEIRMPISRYLLTSIVINGDSIHIYAHQSINVFDAWHRLVHRYPRPNEHERH